MKQVSNHSRAGSLEWLMIDEARMIEAAANLRSVQSTSTEYEYRVRERVPWNADAQSDDGIRRDVSVNVNKRQSSRVKVVEW